MFTEPQTVTVATVGKTLPRVAFGDRRGTFSSVADGIKLSVSHNSGKREASTVRIDFTKTAADPLLDGVSKLYSMSVYLTTNYPSVGFSAAEQTANIKALVDWLAVAGNLTKVVNGES